MVEAVNLYDRLPRRLHRLEREDSFGERVVDVLLLAAIGRAGVEIEIGDAPVCAKDLADVAGPRARPHHDLRDVAYAAVEEGENALLLRAVVPARARPFGPADEYLHVETIVRRGGRPGRRVRLCVSLR